MLIVYVDYVDDFDPIDVCDDVLDDDQKVVDDVVNDVEQ